MDKHVRFKKGDLIVLKSWADTGYWIKGVEQWTYKDIYYEVTPIRFEALNYNLYLTSIEEHSTVKYRMCKFVDPVHSWTNKNIQTKEELIAELTLSKLMGLPVRKVKTFRMKLKQ